MNFEDVGNMCFFKDIGLKLVTAEERHVVASLNCFGTMDYENFKFSKSTPGLRIRQEPPEETRTGYIWHGYGGDLSPSAERCGVYIYCERAGERDLHFSEVGCERLTEAPGASQGLCSNMRCGVVKWHCPRRSFIMTRMANGRRSNRMTLPLSCSRLAKKSLCGLRSQQWGSL